MAVHFEVHFDGDLAEIDVCDLLQAWLRDHSPRFASGLRVLAYERDPDAIPVDVSHESSLRQAMLDRGLQRGATFQALSEGDEPAPYARRFGSVFVRGKAPKTFLGIHFDEYHPGRPMGDKWLWSNSLTGTIDTPALDRIPAAEWVLAALEAFGSHPALLWAAAYDPEEWRAHNMHDEGDGMWALGRDIRRSLPGLFWLNVFGKPYVDLIGRVRLTDLPVGSVTSSGDAVVLRLYESPEFWSNPTALADHARAAELLGAGYFFDRRFPDRPTSAPDFGLAEQESRGTLQAIASEDGHLTVLPPAP